MNSANVTSCPTTNLLGICKEDTSISGLGTTSSMAIYYYSGALYNATTAKAACLGYSMTAYGMTTTTTATWYTQP